MCAVLGGVARSCCETISKEPCYVILRLC